MTPMLPRSTLAIGLSLAVLLAMTRSHHFATMTHLPDASWAVFFLAGFYLRPLWVFPALLALAGASDYVAINWFAVSDFCISPAYALLVPAYGTLWWAGRWYARRHRLALAALTPLVGSLLVGAFLCEIFSSGGFYFFSGRFAEIDLVTFGQRLAQYFPPSLMAMGFYVTVAAIVHAALGAVGPSGGDAAWRRALKGR